MMSRHLPFTFWTTILKSAVEGGIVCVLWCYLTPSLLSITTVAMATGYMFMLYIGAARYTGDSCWTIPTIMLRGTLTKYPPVGLLITVVLILGGGVGASHRDRYTAGDTRIIDTDLSNCYGITLTVHSDSPSLNARLYALSTAPKLDARDKVKHTLSHHKDSQSTGTFLSGHFYLYAGSNVSVSACTHDHKYRVSIIKGKDNYTLWKNGKEGPSVVEYTCHVGKRCNGDSGPQSSTSGRCESYRWPRKIPAADDWYFTALSTTADVNLYLQRYEYKVEESAILSSCIAGGSKPQSCTVAKTPDASTYLLVIGPGESNAIVEATTSCASDSSQLQMYTIQVAILVLLTILFGIIAVILCVCTIRCVVCSKKGKEMIQNVVCRTKGKEMIQNIMCRKKGKERIQNEVINDSA